MAYASELAYKISKGGTLDPTEPHYGEVIATTPTCYVGGTDLIDAGFIAEMPQDGVTDDLVVVALRGTIPPGQGPFERWVHDWLQDFEIGPVPWTVGGQRYGSVEGGFAASVTDLWSRAPGVGPRANGPGLAGALLRSGIDWGSKRAVYVTGHSKGAAGTFLAASLIRHALAVIGHGTVPVEVVCFAAPMTCDAAFRTSYTQAGLAHATTIYQNTDDLVPYLPQYPVFGKLATALRRAPDGDGADPATLELALHWEYVSVGRILYITRECTVDSGSLARYLADFWIADDLFRLDFRRIVDAHSLVPAAGSSRPTGRYTKGACGVGCGPTAA